MKQALAPLSAGICIPAAAGLASLLDASIAMAVAGAGLALVFSLLEWGATALAERGSFQRSVVVGVGGMVVRMAVVVGALAAIGVATSRQSTLVAITAFLGAFTVSFVVRLAVVAKAGGGGVAGGITHRSGGSAPT